MKFWKSFPWIRHYFCVISFLFFATVVISFGCTSYKVDCCCFRGETCWICENILSRTFDLLSVALSSPSNAVISSWCQSKYTIIIQWRITFESCECYKLIGLRGHSFTFRSIQCWKVYLFKHETNKLREIQCVQRKTIANDNKSVDEVCNSIIFAFSWYQICRRFVSSHVKLFIMLLRLSVPLIAVTFECWIIDWHWASRNNLYMSVKMSARVWWKSNWCNEWKENIKMNMRKKHRTIYKQILCTITVEDINKCFLLKYLSFLSKTPEVKLNAFIFKNALKIVFTLRFTLKCCSLFNELLWCRIASCWCNH